MDATVETPEDIEVDPAGVVKRWLLELKLSDKREAEWRKKADKVWSRYRQKDNKKNSFNILWANTETMRPAIYNSLPKPDVRRRFKDADPIGKSVSEILRRSIEYGIDTSDFDSVIKASVLDMLLPGRGLARVRYVPSFKDIEYSESADQEELEGDSEELAWEQAPIEHVQWDDFRIGPGKEWSELPWIGFKHRLTRDELVEQFGEEIGSKVQLDNTDDDDLKNIDDQIKETFKTSEVWEIWDKDERKVLFIAKGYKDAPLNTLDDPLNLELFWPIPRPLYAIEDSSSLIPVPIYDLYREQAEELDQVSTRINKLIRGLKMRGIYDSTLSELSELMRGEDNDLIPAQNVTALMERGGLEKAIWFMPIEQAANVLKELYTQREAVKAVIYELTGISDIRRGASDPNETAAAQQLKATFGSQRTQRMIGEVARFIRDLMRIQSEIIAEKFQVETFQGMTGMKIPTDADKQQAFAQYQQQVQQAQMQAQQSGHPPQPIPPFNFPPTWEDIIKVMRDDTQRTYKVDVETDSTVAGSIETDMQGLQQLLGAVEQTITGLGNAVMSGMLPIEAVKEIILAITRRAKMGNAVEDALDGMKQPNPPPDPNAIKAQADAQLQQQQQVHDQQIEQGKAAQAQQDAQMDFKMEQAKNAMAAQLEQHKQSLQAQQVAQQNQIEAQREQLSAQNDAKLEAMKIAATERQASMQQQIDMLIARLNNEAKVEVAEIAANTSLQTAQIGAAKLGTEE